MTSNPLFERIERQFRGLDPDVGFCSLRVVDQRSQALSVRQDIVQPMRDELDLGAMVTVIDRGGIGYAATGDLSEGGLQGALRLATGWARRTAAASVCNFGEIRMPHPRGAYESAVGRSWESLALDDKIDLLRSWSARMKRDSRIVDWDAALWSVRHDSLYLTSGGGSVRQVQHLLSPNLSVTASRGNDTQTRSLGGYAPSRQGGLELIDQLGIGTQPEILADEALALLAAPNCPTGTMDLLLAPDQMMLQIHESIGHPIELDRILGDERNYAGASFVTLEMFGNYRYGSDLLNVTFDPLRPHEFAAYAFDDDGGAAGRSFLIERGILVRPLGGLVSRTRAGVANADAVATARAASWNRPPIDRMANLNVEPGDASFEQMVRSVKRGIYMRTNRSWSIDDSRNKFQFGCEWAQLIENGKRTKVVKNPNYRGISSTFWRSLAAVGDAATSEMHGTPFCGKGEPNQVIRVGHASPACLFRGVDVFGGA